MGDGHLPRIFRRRRPDRIQHTPAPLDVDALQVESFDTAAHGGRATVVAHGSIDQGGSCLETCNCLPTAGPSACPEQCSNYDGCSIQGTCNYSCRSEPCVCVPQG